MVTKTLKTNNLNKTKMQFKHYAYLWLFAACLLFSCQKEEVKPIDQNKINQHFSGFAKSVELNNVGSNERKVLNPLYPPGTYFQDIQISVIDYTPIGVIVPTTFVVRIIYTKSPTGAITSIQMVESSLSGVSIGSHWSTKDWAAVVSGNHIWFEIHGDFVTGGEYQGIKYSSTRQIESNGYVNVETGEFITTWHTDDNTTPGVLHNWNPSQPANGTYAPYSGSSTGGGGGGGNGGGTGGGIGGGWQGGGDGGGWSGGINGGGNGGGSGNGGGNGGSGSGSGNGGSGAEDGKDLPVADPGDHVAGTNPDIANPLD